MNRQLACATAVRRFAPTIAVAALSALYLALISAATGGVAAANATSAIFVTTTSQTVNGDDQCSLPEAIDAANRDTNVMPNPVNPAVSLTTACMPGDGADTIQLPPGATFTMSGPLN